MKEVTCAVPVWDTPLIDINDMQSLIFKYYDKNLLAIFLIMVLLRDSYSRVFGMQYFLVF